MWIVMRCDYSGFLYSFSDGRYLYSSYRQATDVAKVYRGHAVKWKVAKKILTINKMIGRRD